VNGAIIHKTLVLWVALFAIPFLGEKLSKIGWVAVLAIFAANVLVGGFGGFTFSVGELYVLAATVFWAAEIILAKKVLPKVDPDLLVEARMGIGALMLLSMSVILKPEALSSVLTLTPDKLFWILLTMASLLAYLVVWYRGLKIAPATTATAVLVTSTLVTNMLSAIFVTHSINTLLILKSLLVGTGLFILYKIESGSLAEVNESTIASG
jgi:drug/metabolite transporter (DMT)-like permease